MTARIIETMKMSVGVEWALHGCLSLAMAGAFPRTAVRPEDVAPSDAEGRPITTARLAELHGIAPASLNKTFQQLVRADVVRSVSGPGGGLMLTRHPADITFLDVVDAVEGAVGAFRCTELRQRGPVASPPEALLSPCAIAATMAAAENAWRAHLAQVSIADIASGLATTHPAVPGRTRDYLTKAPSQSASGT